MGFACIVFDRLYFKQQVVEQNFNRVVFIGDGVDAYSKRLFATYILERNRRLGAFLARRAYSAYYNFAFIHKKR